MALLAALAMAVAMLVAMSAPSKASAATFCDQVMLAPYGQHGDQCHMPVAQADDWKTLGIITNWRAGCVALLGYYGEQLDSWVCTGAWNTIHWNRPAWRPAGFYRAAIRNNNYSYAGQYTGLAYK